MDLRKMEKFVWYIIYNRLREDNHLHDDITEQGVNWGITFTDAKEERLQKAISIVQEKIFNHIDNVEFMSEIQRIAKDRFS
jgi:hypothetical protein